LINIFVNIISLILLISLLILTNLNL
jgi:hypothetical protein